MCGIVGFINKNGQSAQKSKLIEMANTILHRGPDAEGYYLKENLALAHRRLSIVDLSLKGKQPMESQDGKFIIVFNGEIYNYKHIKHLLQSHGIDFHTQTDTEVILEAYRYWGKNCVEHFIGMWAFCLYDLEKNKLFLSRDRLGEKPLYYINREDVFVFASEIKAILALLPEEKLPNEDMICNYIVGKPNDSNHETFYKNILRFEQAYSMSMDLQTYEYKHYRYWDIDINHCYEKWIAGKNPLKTFRYLIEDSIKMQLQADVPVGTCLSGGLDSSLIVGIASKKYHHKMHTFSSIYNEVECNEKKYIDAVNHYNHSIPHYIYPTVQDNFIEELIEIIKHHDGPDPGASLYSQYTVFKNVTPSIKVLLDGQGADELFAGYESYFVLRIKDILLKNTLYSKIKALKMFTYYLKEWPHLLDYFQSEDMKQILGKTLYKKLKRSNNIPITPIYSLSKPLLAEQYKYSFREYELCDKKISKNHLDNQLYQHTINSRLPELLHNEDGNAMAFSKETRLPFLDYRLVEFAMALDGKYKIKNEWSKWIIRRSCKKYLPKMVRVRKQKLGFPAPFDYWLRESCKKEEMKKIIFSFGERGFIPKSTIEAYYNQHIKFQANRENFLYKTMQLELWFRECIEK